MFTREIISWLFKDPVNSGLAQFDHVQSNSKKWAKGLLKLSCTYWPLSLCKILKKILRVDQELWGCAIFGTKMTHLSWTYFFGTNHYYYFYLPISPFHCAKLKKIFLLQILFLLQLAHDVVTTLSFGCILVATSDNVVTTLSQHCVSDVITTTKN